MGVTVFVRDGVLVNVDVTVAVGVGVADGENVAVGDAVCVGVRVAVGSGVDVLAGGLVVLVAAGATGGGSYWEPAWVAAGVWLAIQVAVTVGATASVRVGSSVGRTCVGVTVTGKRRSGVAVGTGDESTACSVPTRSRGLPVAGISVMIWSRIFSLMAGMDCARGSAL